MERRVKEEGSDSSGYSVVDIIKKLAAHNARAPLDTEEQLLLFLKSWWSRTYDRPLKDPLLLTYTLEELLYEFYDRIERTKAEEERLEQESDKIEDDKDRAAVDWAEQQEKLDLAAEAAEVNESDPTKDPENIAWMEKQMEEAKQLYGESFGEDVDLDFEE